METPQFLTAGQPVLSRFAAWVRYLIPQPSFFGPGGGQTGRQARPPRFDFSTSSGTSWSSDVLPVGSNDTTTWSQMAGVWYGFATGVNQTLTYATGNTDQGTNMQRITVNKFGFTNVGADTFAVSDFSAALSYLTVLDSQLCCCMMCCAPWVRTCRSQTES